MRRLLFVLPIIALTFSFSGPAHGQGGTICLFADVNGNQCSLTDAAPGLMTVYAVHQNTAGATASQFSAPIPDCMSANGATFLSDQHPFPVSIGSSQDGIAIGYGACLSSPIHVLTINYFALGLTPADCPYPVLPDPNVASGTVDVADCNNTLIPGLGGTTYVNSALPCDCPDGPPPDDPVLSVTPTLVDLGATETNESFFVSNAGGGTLTWSLSESAAWLTVFPTGGIGNQNVAVQVDRSNLQTGNYAAAISVTSNGGDETVTVMMSVAPALNVTPPTLSFPVGTDSQPLMISNAGAGTLLWNVVESISWLSATPAQGTNDGVVTVTVDRTGLSNGNYGGTLSVTSNGGNRNVPVSMQVLSNPQLSVTPPFMNFMPSTPPRALTISNVGCCVLNWTITPSDPWIVVNGPPAGSGDHVTTVEVDQQQLPGDNASGSINIASNGGSFDVIVTYSQAPGFGGTLRLANDPNGAECAIPDEPGLKPIYVVHTNTPGATASQFSAPAPACLQMVYLSDTPTFGVTIGNSQTGVSVGYGACLGSPIQVLTINYFAQGLTPDCCLYPVLPDPNVPSGRIEVVDCSSALVLANGGDATVNENPGCPCGALKTEQATWGQIKALYAPESANAIRRR